MRKNVSILLLLLFGISFCAISEQLSLDISEKVQQMRKSGKTCAGGVSEKLGIYIISITEFELDNDVNQQEITELAIAQAKKEIAAFIGQEMSSKETVSTVVGSVDDQKKSKEFYESISTMQVNQFLRGVVLYEMQKTTKGISIVCLATGQAMDMAKEMKARMAKNPPGTVSATGFAYIVNNRIDVAKQQSLRSALRSAVEQVLGTLLVGNSQVQNNEKIKSKIFAHASGFVEEYRIVSESERDGNYQTVIYAKVSQNKLLDSYSAYLKSFGDPAFLLVTNNKELYQTFTKFFVGLGLKMTADEAKADYIIDAMGDYRSILHPASGVPGIQLSLWIRISDANTQIELLSQKNDPRRSAVFHSSGERQKDLATEKAFAQIRTPLHEALNQMIGNMTASGREITIVIDNFSEAYSEAVSPFCKALEMVPGCGNVNRKIDLIAQTVTLSVNYQGKTDDLCIFLENRLKEDISERRLIPKVTSIGTNRIEMSY